MAGKRRSKRRLGIGQTKAQTTPATMSSVDSSNPSGGGGGSGRLSSDEGTHSEPATSESVATSMTSVMGTDDGIFDNETLDEDQVMSEAIEEEEEDNDFQSVYFANQYPEVSSSYRTEMPFIGEDG